jgi:hypothetical protein
MSVMQIGAHARRLQLREDPSPASLAHRSKSSLDIGREETENAGGKLAVASR